MKGDIIVLLGGRQINDADSIVVNFNLLFSMSTALIGSVDYYFVNQINFLCFFFTFAAANVTENRSRSVARLQIDTLGRDRLATVVFKLTAFVV
jgi:hypothetical protein